MVSWSAGHWAVGDPKLARLKNETSKTRNQVLPFNEPGKGAYHATCSCFSCYVFRNSTASSWVHLKMICRSAAPNMIVMSVGNSKIHLEVYLVVSKKKWDYLSCTFGPSNIRLEFLWSFQSFPWEIIWKSMENPPELEVHFFPQSKPHHQEMRFPRLPRRPGRPGRPVHALRVALRGFSYEAGTRPKKDPQGAWENDRKWVQYVKNS